MLMGISLCQCKNEGSLQEPAHEMQPEKQESQGMTFVEGQKEIELEQGPQSPKEVKEQHVGDDTVDTSSVGEVGGECKVEVVSHPNVNGNEVQQSSGADVLNQEKFDGGAPETTTQSQKFENKDDSFPPENQAEAADPLKGSQPSCSKMNVSIHEVSGVVGSDQGTHADTVEPHGTNEQGDSHMNVLGHDSSQVSDVSMKQGEDSSERVILTSDSHGADIQKHVAVDPSTIGDDKNTEPGNDHIETESKDMVGRKVRKKFGRKKYLGDVVSYDSGTHWFRVLYEDGDVEDLEREELKEILLPLDGDPQSISNKRSPGSDATSRKSFRTKKAKILDLPSTPGSLKRSSKSKGNKSSIRKNKGRKSSTPKSKGSKVSKSSIPKNMLKSSTPKSKVSKSSTHQNKGSKPSTPKNKGSKLSTPKSKGKERKASVSSSKREKKTPLSLSTESTESGSKRASRKRSLDDVKDLESIPVQKKPKDSSRKSAFSSRQKGTRLPDPCGIESTLNESDEVRGRPKKSEVSQGKERKRARSDDEQMGGIPPSERKEKVVGMKVRKDFGGVLYNGKVVAFKKFYQVLYEDGDKEELTWTQLEKILVPRDNNALQQEKTRRSRRKLAS
ncbi:uncharacterized protein LOC18429552 isoform X1 [Amborella trichopoda]|uniref:uncharacterized protein LOC18429552 isoform X1 n=1 Tax=Amborella trichopoda TaxID=13333 RepID=UPI0005D2F1B8|nr:uncharacterized protein LOC18429552 isoform X1 [Amborella trichopoda]|eukprot:XP_011621622.1 uncharacterized protein LOC18429552 isoform X1 [Amborella trichopoda]